MRHLNCAWLSGHCRKSIIDCRITKWLLRSLDMNQVQNLRHLRMRWILWDPVQNAWLQNSMLNPWAGSKKGANQPTYVDIARSMSVVCTVDGVESFTKLTVISAPEQFLMIFRYSRNQFLCPPLHHKKEEDKEKKAVPMVSFSRHSLKKT